MEVVMINKEDLIALAEEAARKSANLVLSEKGIKDVLEDNTKNEQKLIRGINGLAEFLGVSIPTAMKMKKNKLFPYIQYGRTLIFKPNEVLDGLSKNRHRL